MTNLNREPIGPFAAPPHGWDGAEPCVEESMLMIEDVSSNNTPIEERPHFTWRCERCGAEFDYFTYGGPCPGSRIQGCGGELRRRKLRGRV